MSRDTENGAAWGERRCSSSYEHVEVARGVSTTVTGGFGVRVVSASGTGGFGLAAQFRRAAYGPGRGGHGQQGRRGPERPQQRARVEPDLGRPGGQAGHGLRPHGLPGDQAEAA